MAVNKNFVVKNGLEVNSQLIFADAANNKVGIASTQPNVELDVRGGIAATNTTVSGISTIQTGLRVGSGIAGTIFTALDSNVVGIGTSIPVFLLDIRDPSNGGIGTVFNVMGDSLLDHVSADSLKVSGISTFDRYGNFRDGLEVTIGVGTFANLDVIGLSTFTHYVDIGANVGITSTLVVGAGLSVSGISTLTGLLDVNGGVTVTGISTFSNQIDADASIELAGGLSVTGLSTFTGNVDINSDVDINRSLSVTGGATVTGLSTFSSNVDINADVDVNRSISISGGLQATGIGTIGRVKIFNDGTGGIVTATTGIVTYYGDGQYLTNIQSGVGIATTNPSTGYSEIVGLGATIITFAGPGVSTNATHAGGTGVTINPSSGIATVYLSGGGGGGGGFETTIVRDSTTVSGTQSVFTSSSPYTSGYIDIFVNGIKQNAGDFTETNGALGTVTLSTAAVDGDIVELVNYEVVAITGEVETLITKEEFTVTTATQTVFDLASTYTTGYIDVYLNGVRLTGSDYTETDSDTITLTTAATFGDIVEFVSFEKRSISELAPVWRNDSVGSGSGGIYTFTSVGVGTAEQTAFFEVYGPAKFRTGIVSFTNSADTDIVRITDGGFNVISGITTLGGNVNSSGNFDINGTDHDFNGTIALDNVQVSAGATIEGNLTLTGAGSTSSIAGALQLTNVNVSGISTSDFAVITNDLTVNGNLNVNGTTTTLDTIVQEVDLLNIQANSATPGLGVTQSGAGAIIAAYDGTSEVFRVNDGGSVGIGTDNPANRLEIFDTAATVLKLNSTNTNGANLRIQSNKTDKMFVGLAGDFITGQGSNVTDSAIRASGALLFASGGGTERFRITSGGNVNIGGNYAQTTYTSQVTGTLNVTGNITQNGAKLTTTGKAIAMSMIFG
jgi:hypothetical protein